MNTEGEEMETYHIFVVLMGNTIITKEPDLQEPQDSETPNIKIEKERDDLDYKEAPKDSVSPSDKIEKSKEDLVAPSA